jgi:RNA-directed DNA polymerase
MVRYANDFMILCPSAEKARKALQEVKAWVEDNGLSLNPDKTHTGDCRVPGQGFEFLGYRFEAGRRWVRKTSLQRFKDRVREKTSRSRGDSLKRIIAELSPLIRSWYGYFKHAWRSTFPGLDKFIRRRLRRSCAGRKNDLAAGGVMPITNAGPMRTSLNWDSSP